MLVPEAKAEFRELRDIIRLIKKPRKKTTSHPLPMLTIRHSKVAVEGR